MHRILHIALTTDWDDARAEGSYRVSSRGQKLSDVGFIHASTSRQIEGVLARFYADVDPADLCLLVVDVEAVEDSGSPVRWDELPGLPDLTGPPEKFPHIYGPVLPSSVVAVMALGGRPGAVTLPDLTDLSVVAEEPADTLSTDDSALA